MPFKKIALCYCICFLCFIAVTAQIPASKTRAIIDSVNHHWYLQRPGITRLLLHDSVFYQYDAKREARISVSSQAIVSSFKHYRVQKPGIAERMRANQKKIPRLSQITTPWRCLSVGPVKRRLILGSEFVEKGPVFITRL